MMKIDSEPIHNGFVSIESCDVRMRDVALASCVSFVAHPHAQRRSIMTFPGCRSGNVDRTLLAIAVLTLLPFVPGERAHADSPVNLINAEAAKANITSSAVRGGVSVVMGSGGNIAVLSNAAGKLIVDSGIALSRPRLDEVIDQLGSGKPKFLINTHWHWDHTDGNAGLHARGATIVAHPNTLKHVSETITVPDWQHTFQPLPTSGRPTSMVENERTIQFGDETALIKHYGPAHTDGDLYVYFRKADVLVTGDTYWNGIYPFIDSVAGGNIDGMIRATELNIARITDNTLIIPGHGAVARRSDLREFRDMLVAIRDNVAALKKQGKSLEETIAAKPTAAFDAKWGQFVIDPKFFTRLVYRGV
jgi:glyoxylase-like metal-dependent hydrolase (beta-lactamase superfamily II)